MPKVVVEFDSQDSRMIRQVAKRLGYDPIKAIRMLVMPHMVQAWRVLKEKKVSYVTPKKSRLVMERDGGKCRYCGDEAWQIDHIVPRVSFRASDKIENMVAACGRCNLLASGMEFEDLEAKKRWISEQIAVACGRW